jgi:hypothetical protein
VTPALAAWEVAEQRRSRLGVLAPALGAFSCLRFKARHPKVINDSANQQLKPSKHDQVFYLWNFSSHRTGC